MEPAKLQRAVPHRLGDNAEDGGGILRHEYAIRLLKQRQSLAQVAARLRLP
jgi:hypothetical protein